MKLLIFEGCSGVGKTSVISEFRKLIGINKKHDLLIDRFIHSRYVFDKMYNRGFNYFEYIPIYICLKLLGATVIYLTINEDISLERCLNKKDYFISQKKDISQERKYYSEAFSKFPLKRISIDCNDKNVLEIASEIYKEII